MNDANSATGAGGWQLSDRRGTPPFLRPWKGDAEVPARLRSAAALLRFAATDPSVTVQHRKRLIKDLLWDLTEADGKFQTRYRSEGTRLLGARDDWARHLRHEHVFTRARLREDIVSIGSGPTLEAVLATATGCIVTVAEHELLTPHDRKEIGWARYRAAGVPVWDLAANPPRLLDSGDCLI